MLSVYKLYYLIFRKHKDKSPKRVIPEVVLDIFSSLQLSFPSSRFCTGKMKVGERFITLQLRSS